MQHVNSGSFFDGPAEQGRHVFIGDVLVDCHVLGDLDIAVYKVWKVREVEAKGAFLVKPGLPRVNVLCMG